ncbi:CYTH and CHAD domain-containing protein [Kitasatospora sp. NPDC005748]|uniref:CYTH and CHAD domain-containing protein n=1 Tax=Kitasatospora sp. NPDC005748 TaxID=3157063 RepID=UPI0033EFCF50
MATVHEETEQSYDGAPSRALAPDGLPGVAEIAAGTAEILDAVYYDTPDLRLLRGGITVRRRTGGHDAGWHLKIPHPDGHRTELRLPLEAGTARRPPQELVTRTRGAARGSRLAPVAHLRTRRDRTLLLDAGHRTLAELAQDEVSAQILDPGRLLDEGQNLDEGQDLDGSRPRGPQAAARPDGSGPRTELVTWTETEVELVDGGPDLLDAVDRRLREDGLRRTAAPSKLGRLLADRLPPDRRPTAPPAGSVGAVLTAYLREQTATLHDLDPAVRLDRPDSVHRMRVSVRRLRSALTAHRRLLDRATTDHLAEELRWLGKVLGKARDAEVLGERLGTQAGDLPPVARPGEVAERISAWFDHRYARAHRAAVHTMDGRRYYALLDSLDEFAAAPPLRARAERGAGQARRALKREQRRTGRRLRSALDLPAGTDRDQALHRARKAAKRARYTAESLSPLAGTAGRRFGKRMKRIQKALGAHQDGVVAEQALLPVAAAAGDAGQRTFGYGLLYALQRAGTGEQLATARRTWHKLRH